MLIIDTVSTSTIDNKSSMLLHLVGFLSSRFPHDARSQEHNVTDKYVTENQNTHFIFNKLFFEILPFVR